MVIAITGATGFIGRALVDQCLVLGYEVRILTRKPQPNFPKAVKIFTGNILDDHISLIAFLKKVDVFYHCAAEIKDEALMDKVNIDGTSNLINAAKGNIKHWIQLSSTGVYGPVYNGMVKESQALNPVNTYEISKVKSDFLVIDAGKQGYFSYTIIRPSNVFGGSMSNQSLFQLVKAVDKHFFFFIGPKGANANYVPVENVVHALVLAGQGENAKGKIYNISDYLKIEEFIAIIARCLQVDTPKLRIPLYLINFIAKIGDMIPRIPLTSARVKALTNKVVYDNGLIEAELGYRPLISIEEGIGGLVSKYLSDKKNHSI